MQVQVDIKKCMVRNLPVGINGCGIQPKIVWTTVDGFLQHLERGVILTFQGGLNGAHRVHVRSPVVLQIVESLIYAQIG